MIYTHPTTNQPPPGPGRAFLHPAGAGKTTHMGKYITNNDRRPSRPGFYRVIYSDGNTGVEHFDGTTWQVEYSHPVDRWLEEKPAAGPLSPAEWLEQNMFSYPSGPEQWKNAMQEYAAHVAACVARNTLNRVVEIQSKHFFSVEGLHSATELNQAIMNIPLRGVLPAGEKTETNG